MKSIQIAFRTFKSLMKQIPLLFIPFITFFDPLTFWEPSQDFFGKLVFHFWWHWNWAWQVPSQHLSPRHSRYCSTPSNAFWQPWLNHDFNSMLYISWDISIYDVIEDSQLWHGMKILQWWEIRALVRMNWMRKKDHNWCQLRSTWDFLVTEFTNSHQLTTKIRIIDHVRKFGQFKVFAVSTLQVLYKMYVTKESSDLTSQLKIRVVGVGSLRLTFVACWQKGSWDWSCI